MPFAVAADDQPWETWDDPVRGRLRWCLLDDGTSAAPETVTTGVMTLDEDGWLGRHRHAAPEVYYVVEGQASVEIDGEEQTVSAGSLVRLPGDSEHAVRAVGGPVRLLFVFPTATFGHVAYRFSADDAA